MSALAGAIVASATALGVLLVVRGLVPPRPSLSSRLDLVLGVVAEQDRRFPAGVERFGRAEAALVRGGSADGRGERLADLAVAAIALDRWHRWRLAVVAAAAGLLALSVPVAVSAAAAGRSAAGVVATAAGPPTVAAVVGWWAAERLLISRARTARVEFGHAVGGYLELATVSLAGGAGPAEAMRAAASMGSGLAFRQIRGAVAEAELRLHSPYRALEALGSALAVAELVEVGSAMALAEEKGVSIRATLEAKADAVLSRLTSREEAAAESRSVMMSLPSVLMLSGFLLFLMYPFVSALVATTR